MVKYDILVIATGFVNKPPFKYDPAAISDENANKNTMLELTEKVITLITLRIAVSIIDLMQCKKILLLPQYDMFCAIISQIKNSSKIAVIGGGASGVELCGEIKQLYKVRVLADFLDASNR